MDKVQKQIPVKTARVFRTVYNIVKKGRPYTDMALDIELQELNGRVLHSRKSCADIAHHIGNEVRKAVVENIVLKLKKMSVMIDESTTTNSKTVLLICLRTTVGKSGDPQTFSFDLEHVKCSTNAKAIYGTLLNCLQKLVFPRST
jgi:hypothetical protein